MNAEEQKMVKAKTSISSKILFCTVTDNNYFPGACVLLYSLLKQIPNFLSYDVKVICSDTIAPLRDEYKAYLKKIVPNILFENVMEVEYTNATTKVPDHKPAFLTLNLFKQYEWDKVVFMDADTLCYRDFSELLKMSRGFMGAVHPLHDREAIDTSLPKDAVTWNRFSGSRDEINTGFLIVDRKYLNEFVYKQLLSSIPQNTTFLADQPIINRYFGHRLHIPLYKLPKTYNFNYGGNELFFRYSSDIKVIHFCGQGDDRRMPWEPDADSSDIVNRIWQAAEATMIEEYGEYRASPSSASRIYRNSFPLCSHSGKCNCASIHDFRSELQKVLNLAKPNKIYEWGPGVSTKQFLATEAVEIVSVEHDARWSCPYIEDPKFSCRLSKLQSSEYISIEGFNSFDLYFVDGRRRRECIESIYQNAKDEAIVCLHDAQRERYNKAIRLFPYVVFLSRTFCVMSKSGLIIDLLDKDAAS